MIMYPLPNDSDIASYHRFQVRLSNRVSARSASPPRALHARALAPQPLCWCAIARVEWAQGECLLPLHNSGADFLEAVPFRAGGPR